MQCPKCGAKQNWGNVRFGRQFHCLACDEALRVPQSYLTKGSLPSVAFAVFATYWLGIRGYMLALAPVGLFFLFSFVVGTVTRKVFPPRLEIVGE